VSKLLFFNSEGYPYNFEYDAVNEQYSGKLLFDDNSNDTFKTISMYVFEEVEPIFLEAELILSKVEIYNYSGISFKSESYMGESILNINKVNSSPDFYSKWIYGIDFDSKFQKGTIISFSDLSFISSTTDFDLNYYTIVDNKPDAVMIITATDNETWSDTFITGGTMTSHNIISYNDYDTTLVSTIGGYGLYEDKKLSISGSLYNDGVNTFEKSGITETYYQLFDMSGCSVDDTFRLDLTLFTERPKLYQGEVEFTLTADTAYLIFTNGFNSFFDISAGQQIIFEDYDDNAILSTNPIFTIVTAATETVLYNDNLQFFKNININATYIKNFNNTNSLSAQNITNISKPDFEANIDFYQNNFDSDFFVYDYYMKITGTTDDFSTSITINDKLKLTGATSGISYKNDNRNVSIKKIITFKDIRIKYWKDNIKNSPGWLNSIKTTAFTKNTTLQTQLETESLYLYNNTDNDSSKSTYIPINERYEYIYLNEYIIVESPINQYEIKKILKSKELNTLTCTFSPFTTTDTGITLNVVGYDTTNIISLTTQILSGTTSPDYDVTFEIFNNKYKDYLNNFGVVLYYLTGSTIGLLSTFSLNTGHTNYFTPTIYINTDSGYTYATGITNSSVNTIYLETSGLSNEVIYPYEFTKLDQTFYTKILFDLNNNSVDYGFNLELNNQDYFIEFDTDSQTTIDNFITTYTDIFYNNGLLLYSPSGTTYTYDNFSGITTSLTGDPAVSIGITSTPENYVKVFVNDLLVVLGNGIKTKDCYFSNDLGVTSKSLGSIESGDILYWNGTVAGYEIITGDTISYIYIENSTVDILLQYDENVGLVTTSDGDLATTYGITQAISNNSYIKVYLNGVLMNVGDEVKTTECYFSNDSGYTSTSLENITTDDFFYWNGSIAGYEISTGDTILYIYITGTNNVKSILTTSNTLATISDGELATLTEIETPYNDSFVEIYINGLLTSIGDGVKTKHCYFSDDAGVTAKLINNITYGDLLYWNGSIAGYQLTIVDIISFLYFDSIIFASMVIEGLYPNVDVYSLNILTNIYSDYTIIERTNNKSLFVTGNEINRINLPTFYDIGLSTGMILSVSGSNYAHNNKSYNIIGLTEDVIQLSYQGLFFSDQNDLTLITQSFLRKPRESYRNDVYYSFKFDEPYSEDIFFYDITGEHLKPAKDLITNEYISATEYIGSTPLWTSDNETNDDKITLIDSPNENINYVSEPLKQQTVFNGKDGEYCLEFLLPEYDSSTNYNYTPEPLQVFIGFNSPDEGVENTTILMDKVENIIFSGYTNSAEYITNNEFTFDNEGLLTLFTSENINFNSLGFSKNQIIDIDFIDENETGTTSFLNYGPFKILYVNKNIIKIDESLLNYTATTFSTSATTKSFKYIIEVKPKTILNLDVYGQTEIEEERFYINLKNLGIRLESDIEHIFKESDIKENGIDYLLLNRKRKEMLSVYPEIYNYIGSYKALINAIHFFGWNELDLNEYYKNINPNSELYQKLHKVKIQDIFDNTVDGWVDNDYIKGRYDKGDYKKTNLFNLTYNITDEEGNNISLYSLEEMQYKLTKLKKWLKKNVIPLSANLVDITSVAQTKPNLYQKYNVSNQIKKTYSTQISTTINFNFSETLNFGTDYLFQLDFYTLNGINPSGWTCKIKTFSKTTEGELIPQKYLKLMKNDLESYSFNIDKNIDQYIYIETNFYNDFGLGQTYNKLINSSTFKNYLLINNNFRIPSDYKYLNVDDKYYSFDEQGRIWLDN